MYCKQCGIEIKDTGLQKCPKCNTTIGKGGRFCEFCGKPKKNPKEACECQTATPVNNDWTCLTCGSKNDGMFCPKCGAPKDSAMQTSTVQTQEVVSEPITPVPTPKVKSSEIKTPTIKTTNPLYAKIAAKDDKKEVAQIVQKQAVKMVYGPEAVEQMNKTEEDVQIDNGAESEVKPVDATPVMPVIETPAPIKEEPKPVISQPVKVEEVKPVSEAVSEPNFEYGNEVVLEEKPASLKDVEAKANDIFPEFAEDKQENKQEIHNDTSSQVTNMFPEAFNEKKLQSPSVNLPKIDRTVTVKEKKTVDFFWIVSMILSYCAFAYFGSSAGATIVSTVLSVIFGLVDTVFSKRKYGLGVIMGTIIMLVIRAIF